MAIAPTYPGVYIEEIPSGVRTITGVSTSVAAFVGYTAKGPTDKAVKIFDFGSFERLFGGVVSNSELGYAVQQFFLNGGTEAWIVRIASGAARAAITIKNTAGVKVLTVTALSEGGWGNNLRVDLDHNTSNPDSTFNLTVTEMALQNGVLTPARTEVHRNLSLDSNAPNYVQGVVNTASALVQVNRHSDVTAGVLSGLPAGSSLSGRLSPFPVGLGTDARFISVTINGDGPYEVPAFAGPAPATLDALVTSLHDGIRSANPAQAYYANVVVERADAAGTADPAGNYVIVRSGAGGETSSVRIASASTKDAATLLKLGPANGGRETDAVASLRPALTGTSGGDLSAFDLSTVSGTAEITLTVANGSTTIGTGQVSLGSAPADLNTLAQILETRLRALAGTQPVFAGTEVEIAGGRLRILTPNEQSNATLTVANVGPGDLADDLRLTGAGSFVNVQQYSLGSSVDRGAQTDGAPGNSGSPPSNAGPFTGSQANKTGIFALEDTDIFNILCIPLTAELGEATALDIISKATAYCRGRRAFYIVDPPLTASDPVAIQTFANKLTPDNYTAIYFPPVRIPDAANNSRLRSVATSGTMAGLYARTDATRGVWKAPAGTEATLSNVQGLAYSLTDRENGPLNQRGINGLRQFPVFGRVSWGARTMRGADQFADDYKYVPVRRFALFLEESLYQGTQWVVFEPNDEPLWAQIRLNIGAFLQTLFRQGAFQGKTPREAYFVKCDKETTTQNDINLGIVNIVVGFAPLKPAEFVIIRVQQMAGQIEV